MKRRFDLKKASPFSEAGRQLAETEAKLKRDMENLQRQIAEAPARKQEQLRRQATEIMRRHEQKRGSDFFSSIPDKRYNSTLAIGPRGKRKGEKRAAQYQFLALMVLLALAIFFVLKMIPW